MDLIRVSYLISMNFDTLDLTKLMGYSARHILFSSVLRFCCNVQCTVAAATVTSRPYCHSTVFHLAATLLHRKPSKVPWRNIRSHYERF